MQIQVLEESEVEYQTFNVQRKQCEDDLKAMKQKTKELIDANEMAPEDEQLPIEEFNVDWDGIAFAEQNAEKQRNEDEHKIREECKQLNSFTEAIKAVSWNQMEVKGRNIRGIFTKLKVENYSLLFPEKQMEQELQRVRVWRRTEQMVAQNDTFQPWVPMSMDELVALLANKPDCITPRNPESMEGGDSMEAFGISITAPKNQYTMTGTSSHMFIKPISLRYSQLEVMTYYQMHLENIMGYVCSGSDL